jgi:uncharacterized protein DUF4307
VREDDGVSNVQQDVQQERYGRSPVSPGRRRALIAAAGLVLTVTLVWMVWMAAFKQPTLRWQEVGFDVRGDAAIVVTFDVFFSGDTKEAVCTVQAENELHTDVGLKDVRLRPGPKGRVRAVVTLPTSEEATTGLVRSCVPAE